MSPDQSPGDPFGGAAPANGRPQQPARIGEARITSLLHRRAARKPSEIRAETEKTFGERMADRFTAGAGSWTFILSFLAFIAVWMIVNVMAALHHWDPYPFILLNLVLSCVAAVQAPIILMSQNREEARDRLRAEADYEVNLKAEVLLEHMTQELDTLKSLFAALPTAGASDGAIQAAGVSVAREGGHVKTIVVGVDGSPGSRVAVEFAAREAAVHGATLRVVSAWEVSPAVLSSGGVAPEIYQGFEAEAQAIARQAAQRVTGLQPSVVVEEKVVEGHAGNVLVDEAATADLVVIGRRGHGSLTEFLLGSVSHQVADHAKCPVVIVPPAPEGD